MTGERLLVVDGSAETRASLSKSILEPEGFKVLLANTGAQGLARALGDSPDLIIISQNLPDISGLEVLEGIQETGQRIPAILLTDKESDQHAVRAMRLGVVEYLKVPPDPARLLAAIRRGLPSAEAAPSPQSAALQSLLDIGQAITSSRDLETVLEQVVEEAIRLCSAEEAVIMLLDPQSEELYTHASISVDENTVRSLRLRVSDSLAGQVINTGQPVLVGEGEHKIKTEYVVKSLIYVPLQLMHQAIGVLSVSNRVSDRYFSAEDVGILSVLSNYAAIAIANARAFDEIRIERARFRTLLEQSSDAVMVVDDMSYITLINQGACEALVLEPLDALGRTVQEAVDTADLRGLFERHEDETITRGEVALADGRTLNAQLTSIKGMGCVAVMQDVTHLKELDRMKTQFVTTVSHDLRSPLTAILGYVELIARAGETNEQQAKFIERVKSSVKAMTSLINDLLDLGRIEAGMDRERESVDIRSLLREITDGLQSRYEAKHQTLEFEDSKDRLQILGNPLRLRQALSNLVDNAIKYTSDKGTISLSANTTDEHIIIVVRDTGIGIPLADQPYVFDEFYRAEAVQASHQGTGLGLAIVKSIVEAHEGRIWVESKTGEGSKFTVMLPAYTEGKGLAESSHAP